MTALERPMPADAVALSKEHADRADAAEARWAALRSEVESMRGDKYQLAGDHEESGHDWQTERCYGAVEALDWMLATIDRMAANPAPAGEE